MLTQRAALELAMAIWEGPRAAEMPRIERIDEAMKVRNAENFVPTVQISEDAPARMRELARKSATNYLPLLVDTFGQVLKVDGYLTTAPQEQSPWRQWQRNRMDARQTGLTRSTLKYGVAYAHHQPAGVDAQGVAWTSIRCYSPKFMTAVYQDPEFDEWPAYTLRLDGNHLIVTDEEADYWFGWSDSMAYTARFAQPAASLALGSGMLTFIEARPHLSGSVPVVRYRDRMLLDGEEQLGIVEPLITLQERIDETGFQQMVAQYTAVFKQRYVIGWVPQSEAEEIKASVARIAYLDADPNEVRFGEWSETPIQPYIDSGAQARRDFAALGQIPAQTLGVDAISNISDATLAGLEAAKNRKASEIATSLGESHEQGFRLDAYLVGDVEAAQDYESEVRWSEREARSWAGTIDGLQKLVAAQILGPETALEMVPGLSEQQVRSARATMRRANAQATLVAAMNRAAATQTPAQMMNGQQVATDGNNAAGG